MAGQKGEIGSTNELLGKFGCFRPLTSKQWQNEAIKHYDSILQGMIRYRAKRGLPLAEVTMARSRKQARDSHPLLAEFFDSFDDREFRRQCRANQEG